MLLTIQEHINKRMSTKRVKRMASKEPILANPSIELAKKYWSLDWSDTKLEIQKKVEFT